ncbi:MAG: divergent PAP2 family protein [Candidatus Omnitrophota bacterium]
MYKDIPIDQFLSNKVVIATFFAWFIAQALKVVFGAIAEKRFNFKWFVGTGGMPSSHTAGVSALTTAVGIQEGVGSALFVVALMFAVVVICDAQGFRRATGKQAEALNKIIDDIYWKRGVQEDRLKELLGHTPVQVFAGLALGIILPFILYGFFF